MRKLVNKLLKSTDYRIISKTEIVSATRESLLYSERYLPPSSGGNWLYKIILDLGRTVTGERK